MKIPQIINWSRRSKDDILEMLSQHENRGEQGIALITMRRTASGSNANSAPHPGVKIREDIDRERRSISEMADALDINRSYLHKLLSGRSGVTAEMAIRLEQVLGRNAEDWLRMQAIHDIHQARSRGIRAKGFTL